MKRKITEYQLLYNYDFDGPIDDVIDGLIENKEHWESLGYKDIKIDQIFSDCVSHSDRYEVTSTREETDDEYKERIAREENAKLIKKERKEEQQKDFERLDRLNYERLKKKYES